jgi:hypothetical protein
MEFDGVAREELRQPAERGRPYLPIAPERTTARWAHRLAYE